MNPKWLIGLILLYLIIAMWSGIIEGSYLTGNSTGVLNSLVRLDPIDVSSITSLASTSFNVGSVIIKAIWDIFWWDFAQFKGDYIIFRYVLISLSVGIAFAIMLSVGRGVSS